MKTIEHFVGGKSFSGDSKRTGKVFNPATGEQSAEVKLATSKDVNQAVLNALIGLQFPRIFSKIPFFKYFIKGVPPVPVIVEPPRPNGFLICDCL